MEAIAPIRACKFSQKPRATRRLTKCPVPSHVRAGWQGLVWNINFINKGNV